MFSTDTGDPFNYLVPEKKFSRELSGSSARSIVIDKKDNIWIGTRNHGISVYTVNENVLVKKFTITTATGLSDDFTTHLACDGSNTIWACSALGLDKITIKNGMPVIENITKQNNIYQSVFKIVIDKNNTAWGLISNGLVKILPENKRPSNYSPSLMLSLVKAGKDTVLGKPSFTHKQNNLSFYYSATSFLDSKTLSVINQHQDRHACLLRYGFFLFLLPAVFLIPPVAFLIFSGNTIVHQLSMRQ